MCSKTDITSFSDNQQAINGFLTKAERLKAKVI